MNLGSEPVKRPAQLPTNFVFVIDVSGSMSNDLGFIRKQLKNKLPNLIKDGDTVTIIWFSGNRDAGILKEEVEVKSLKSLNDLNDAIDKFLKPVGLTAFNKPLVLAHEAIQRMKKNRPNGLFSLIFLTDGGNNDCSFSDVLKSLKKLEGDLAASTFVEYGYYADSIRIGEMAELIGGEKVSAERFDDYDIVFENKIQKTYTSSKKVYVDLPTDRKFEFAFTVGDDNEIILYSIQNNQVLVPENTKSLMVFTTTPHGTVTTYGSTNDQTLNKLMYGSVYALSEKLQNDYADDVLKSLGDERLYKIFTNAYGKQKLLNFKSLVKECVTDPTKQFLNGRSTNLVVDENAYCVMNLIEDLSNDDQALVYPMHEDFNYNRIGAKKVAKDNTAELNEAVKTQIANAKTKEELQAIVDGMDETTAGALKFEYADKEKGYGIDGLVWASDRANLSIRIRYEGYVNLPTNKFGITKIDTFIYRTYTIIKDGILNLTKLPVSMSQATFTKLQSVGVIDKNLFYLKDMNMTDALGVTPHVYTIDFSTLPVINKRMVKSISAKKLAELEYELFQTKALEKVYGYYEKQLFPKTSKGFIDQYGAEAEAWLKGLGITEFNGFNPSMTTEKSEDFYMAVELNTKIALHSALPTVDAVIKAIQGKKALKPAEELMKVAIDDYEAQIASPMYTSLTDETLKKKVLESWLKNVKSTVNKKRKGLLQEIAQIKFSLILSKKWFEEFSTFEEKTLSLKVGKKDLNFEFDLTETQVNL
jgi:hypothetical protein